MTDWNWSLIILAGGAFLLRAALAWHRRSKERGRQAWERMMRERFGDDEEDKQGGNDDEQDDEVV